MGVFARFGGHNFTARQQVDVIGTVDMLTKEHPKQHSPRERLGEKALDGPVTPTGKPPPLAVRLEKALPFRRWVAARASCGGAPRPRPRPNPKHNAENDGQEAHQTMRQSEKRGRGATHASQPHEGCPLLHPLQGASCLSTPLQGGILKPPALRVVDDFSKRAWSQVLHCHTTIMLAHELDRD